MRLPRIWSAVREFEFGPGDVDDLIATRNERTPRAGKLEASMFSSRPDHAPEATRRPTPTKRRDHFRESFGVTPLICTSVTCSASPKCGLGCHAGWFRRERHTKRECISLPARIGDAHLATARAFAGDPKFRPAVQSFGPRDIGHRDEPASDPLREQP